MESKVRIKKKVNNRTKATLYFQLRLKMRVPRLHTRNETQRNDFRSQTPVSVINSVQNTSKSSAETDTTTTTTSPEQADQAFP